MSIKVVISGIHYPVSMMGYFIRAFQRRSDVELITAGPFTGDWIPWAGGITIAKKYIHTPTIPLPRTMIEQRGLPASVIQSQLPWKPDLWLQVDAGWWLQKPDAMVVAHVASDPHVLDYSQQRRQCDYFFNMQTPYIQDGDLWLPYAYDPTIHYAMQLEKVHDACLVGLHYEQRDRLVNRLRGRGLDVYYGLGEVFNEFAMRYNQSKVALSWSSLQDTPTRVFEAMGMKVPLVANRTPDLMTLFEENTHFLGFDSVEEAEAQVMSLLNDPDKASRMANNAHEVVSHRDTWDKRIERILSVCGLEA